MKDFDRLRIRFKQFGGWRLALEYVKLGLLWVIVRELVRCVVYRRSFKSVYPAIGKVVDPMLVEKYLPPAPSQGGGGGDYRRYICGDDGGVVYVWSCWLQGWENAPDLAKACLASWKRNLDGVEIVELDEENYTQWVRLPEYIVGKYRKGRIPAAMFSDLLRLELLVEYGGVWIDSTVLASGCNQNRGEFCPSWDGMVKADLFVFQYTEPGRRWSGNISNWFIA